MKTNISISTAWNCAADKSLKLALDEIKELGLSNIEVGYNFKRDRLDELVALIPNYGFQVSSLHNYCPLPESAMPNRSVLDCYRLSALDERERAKAVEFTKNTIDTANVLSCPVVVIHAGTVELDGAPHQRLLTLFREGKRDSSEYEKAKSEFLDKRRENSGKFLDAIIKSFKEVLGYGQALNVKLGLETRYYPNEIPNIEEAKILLDMFKGMGLVYWHDLGHGEVNERLGIASHLDYLSRFKDHLYGMHIHGVKGLDDHLAPLEGDMYLERFKEFMIKKNLLMVLESHNSATKEQLIKAIDKLKNL